MSLTLWLYSKATCRPTTNIPSLLSKDIVKTIYNTLFHVIHYYISYLYEKICVFNKRFFVCYSNSVFNERYTLLAKSSPHAWLLLKIIWYILRKSTNFIYYLKYTPNKVRFSEGYFLTVSNFHFSFKSWLNRMN